MSNKHESEVRLTIINSLQAFQSLAESTFAVVAERSFQDSDPERTGHFADRTIHYPEDTSKQSATNDGF